MVDSSIKNSLEIKEMLFSLTQTLFISNIRMTVYITSFLTTSSMQLFDYIFFIPFGIRWDLGRWCLNVPVLSKWS